jgi:hypothetical protein
MRLVGGDIQRKTIDEFIGIALFLLVLTLVGLAAFTPWLGLVGDDWWFLAHLTDGQFPAAQLQANPSRPLVAYIWLGLWKLFGLRLWTYYAFSFVVQWLTSLTVFVMLRVSYRWNVMVAAGIGALFLLYPSDTARVYLSTLSTRVGMLLAIAGAALWLRAWYGGRRSIWTLVVALVLMGLSLLIYETPLVLFALLPLTLGFMPRVNRARWIRYACSCYAVLVIFLMFRLSIAYGLARSSTPYYVSLRLAPDWVVTQLKSLPTAALINGWLYSLKGASEIGPVAAAAVVLAVMSFSVVSLLWLGRGSDVWPPSLLRSLGLVAGGAILVVAAVTPVMVSSYPLENTVGTLEGRLLHGAALGSAIFLAGICTVPVILLPLSWQGKKLLQATLLAALLGVAAVGSLQMQQEYVQAWRTQLGIVHDLHDQVAAFADDTTIVLLDVPSGPFDIRFYYPYTELVRRFYGNSTLHVLPWQRGFSAAQQLVAFGQKSVVAVVDTGSREVLSFEYENVVAFRVRDMGDLEPIQQIGSPYLCEEDCDRLLFEPPLNWNQAREPVGLSTAQGAADPTPCPASCQWDRLFSEPLELGSPFGAR